MKTSKETLNNIKNKIITEEMLDSALYSVNKRAKNHRDKENEYKIYGYGKYKRKNIESSRNKTEMMYQYKEVLLSVLQPSCIHKEPKYEKVRVFDFQKDYKRKWIEQYDKVVWENSYFDYERDRYVDFYDYLDKTKIIDHKYYLFYEMKNHTYHYPLLIEDLRKYNDLKIKEIDRLKTQGDDIQDLMSLQTVKKIIQLIKSNSYTYAIEK